jgi:hypothetical protein
VDSRFAFFLTRYYNTSLRSGKSSKRSNHVLVARDLSALSVLYRGGNATHLDVERWHSAGVLDDLRWMRQVYTWFIALDAKIEFLRQKEMTPPPIGNPGPSIRWSDNNQLTINVTWDAGEPGPLSRLHVQ